MIGDRHRSLFPFLIFLLMVLIGFIIRMVDLDDPPLDFNPTRQLRSAIIARGFYYRVQENVDPGIQSLAISYQQAMERLEPPIIESIVAFFYRLIGSEQLWIAKVVSSLFWSIAAFFLYDLGRRMGSQLASLIGVSYFLFLPFGIRASRSFQPDPMLVMGIMMSAWMLFRWNQSRSWKWVVLAGIFGGLTGLVKPVGLLFVGGMLISVVLSSSFVEKDGVDTETKRKRRFDWQKLINPKIWVMVALVVSPLLLYYLINIGEETSDYLGNWTLFSRWRDVLSPSFVIRWMTLVDNKLNLLAVVAGFLGILLASAEDRSLLLGLWIGYILLGLIFPYHILTHDYYHLPLVGLVGLSVAPLFQNINIEILRRGNLIQSAYIFLLVLISFYNAWMGRSVLLGADYHDHPPFWQEVGDAIPADSKVIGITQDYGFRLMYYGWRKIEIWPQGADVEEFNRITDGVDYFVITAKNQVPDDLGVFLAGNFPVHLEGNGYVIYDLNAGKPISLITPYKPKTNFRIFEPICESFDRNTFL